jgi:hypothetical protein
MLTNRQELLSLSDLFSQILHGRLRIPKNSSSLITSWNGDQICLLLDSIRKNYPIGSFFVWQTKHKYQSLECVSGVKITLPDVEPEDSINYLLDGCQRILSLFKVLIASDQETKSSSNPLKMFYNLEIEQFEHSLTPTSDHLAVNMLLDTVSWVQETSKMKKQENLNRAATLVQQLYRYSVPITKCESENPTEAFEAVSRLTIKKTPINHESLVSRLIKI